MGLYLKYFGYEIMCREECGGWIWIGFIFRKYFNCFIIYFLFEKNFIKIERYSLIFLEGGVVISLICEGVCMNMWVGIMFYSNVCLVS